MQRVEIGGEAAVPVEGTGKQYRIFVVHHTHWDREWWTTYQDFRVRLVEVIDTLLDTLDRDPDFRSFLLDGQMIVLRDYLEIRPENRERLAGFLREGRVQCGPWYVLADEFLTSGESHIRNLWLGERVARELRVPTLKLGYLPDTFGHIAQMPQILRGFGIGDAFMWRGRGGDPSTVKEEFLWEAPDGSAVLTYWFPDGYYLMPFLHVDDPHRPYADKLGRVVSAIERWGRRATTDALLMPYGGDHQPIDPDLPRKLREAGEAIEDHGSIHWATPDEFMRAVRQAAPQLETVRGELRAFGAAMPYVLAGVLSTRLYLKVLNARCQTWLERYAEPFSALAWLTGGRYDASLLWKAWELLLQNHPHDSICGCGIDQIHREMLPRFDASQQIARILTEKAVQHLNAQIDTSAFDPGDRPLVVRNPLAWRRDGWAAVWIERAAVSPRTHVLLDESGAEIPFQTRDVEGWRPMSDRWFFTEIGFIARDVPGLGYGTYRLTRRTAPMEPNRMYFNAAAPAAALKGSEAISDLRIGTNLLENRYLRVEVDGQSGTLTISDRRSGAVYKGLNAFEDGGDAGDEYNYSAPLVDGVLRSSRGARVAVSASEVGYARATLRIELEWNLPISLTDDRRSRSPARVGTRISTYVSLAASSPRVDITTEWENRSRDHRLRALFPLGAEVGVSYAQGQFNVAERPVAPAEAGNGWAEVAVPTLPQQGWSAIQSGERSLLVATRGLPEYEVIDGGTLAITLLRAVGWLSREDLLTRAGGTGPQTPTPDAQSLGPNRVSYAIIPFDGDWLRSRAYSEAEAYLAPLYGSETGVHSGEAPLSGRAVELVGDHRLVMSACKKAEDRDELVLRFWNAAGEPATVRLAVPGAVAARHLNLAEEPVPEGSIERDEDGMFVLQAREKSLLTVGIHFGIYEPADPLQRAEGATT